MAFLSKFSCSCPDKLLLSVCHHKGDRYKPSVNPSKSLKLEFEVKEFEVEVGLEMPLEWILAHTLLFV